MLTWYFGFGTSLCKGDDRQNTSNEVETGSTSVHVSDSHYSVLFQDFGLTLMVIHPACTCGTFDTAVYYWSKTSKTNKLFEQSEWMVTRAGKYI